MKSKNHCTGGPGGRLEGPTNQGFSQGPPSSSSSSGTLRRQIVFGVLAVCVSLSRTGEAATEQSPRLEGDLSANCSEPAIEEFPMFFLDQEQRSKGGILVPILIALYLIFALGSICDDYFVPALEIVCDRMHLSPDVAGATFMAAGTSSPEFFANIMGTFVTKSDIGIGTIVGSAVFNIFGIISVCGFFASSRLPLDWYPITRDCICYGVTIIVLIVVLIDEKVYWYESFIMLVFYVCYILIMFFNTRLEKWSHNTVAYIQKKVAPLPVGSKVKPNESTPLKNRKLPSVSLTPPSLDEPTSSRASNINTITTSFGGGLSNSGFQESSGDAEAAPISNTGVEPSGGSSPIDVRVLDASNDHLEGHHNGQVGHVVPEGNNGDVANEDSSEQEVPDYPWQRPSGWLASLWWVVFLPINIVFFLTIPDVRRGKAFKKLYLVSFLMCVAWIGVVAYVVTWMITILGYTMGVPDSVMGLTFLAVGTSIPEVFSSLIVTKQGKGSMAVSNCIGSNTFDILVCLGLPWLIKSVLAGAVDIEGDGSPPELFVTVNSKGLTYTVICLLLSLTIMYALLVIYKFTLTKMVAALCLLIYCIFLTISLLFELNVFFTVNLPPCKSEF